jgi:acetolactate synthase-1/2/3 large subunit
VRDSRHGAVEILASPAETLRAMVERRQLQDQVDRQWAAKRAADMSGPEAAAEHGERAKGSDGKLHPNKVLSAQQAISSGSVIITDGGDFLAALLASDLTHL